MGDENHIKKQIIKGKFQLENNMNEQFLSLFKRCTDFDPQKRIDIDDILKNDFFFNKRFYSIDGNSTKTDDVID